MGRTLKTMVHTNIILCVLCFALPEKTYAEKIVFVKSAIGKYPIYGQVSPKQAREQALAEAKLNALRTAGIAENIASYQMQFAAEYKNDFTEFFTADIQTEIRGAVKSYTILTDTIRKEHNGLYHWVEISAEVIAYTTYPDPGFKAVVEGIQPIYRDKEKLRFKLRSTQTAYLTVFLLTERGNSILYPNDYEPRKPLSAMEWHVFPQNNSTDYTLELEQPKAQVHRLIFVFTKNPYPYLTLDFDTEDLFTWLYSISPDQRTLDFHNFTLIK